MKTIFALLTTLLATANALSVHRPATPNNHIKDGDFRRIPSSDVNKFNFTSFGWAFEGAATVKVNSPRKGHTPSSSKYVAFYQYQGHNTGSVMQHVSGLTGGDFTMTYSHRFLKPSDNSNCNLTATYGKQILSELVYDSTAGTQPWYIINTTFDPAESSAALTFTATCPPGSSAWEIDIDQVSLTGPNDSQP